MMAVAPVSHSASRQAASATATDSNNAALNYDAFLRLLVAEMQNQDPTQPTDPAQSLSQLASFSAVEQSIKTNSKLDTILAQSSVGQAGAIIGHTVSNADGSITGVVRSVTVYSDGSVALLDNGQSLVIGAGIKIQ